MLVISIYDMTSCDGTNEGGLVGNLLYSAESDCGYPAIGGKPKISLSTWLQYPLDNYGTVAEAVEELWPGPLAVVAPLAPNERPGAAHFAISDEGGGARLHVSGQIWSRTVRHQFSDLTCRATMLRHVGRISRAPGV